jgi:CubicO group peptidase (beta-lactamase class C family)
MVLFFPSLELCAQVEFPDSPAGQRAREIFELINGTSTHEPRDYVETNFAPAFREAFPMEMHLGVFERVRSKFGEVTLYSAEEVIANQITCVITNQGGERYLEYTLNVEPDEPHRIARLGIQPTGRPENAPEPISPVKPNGSEATNDRETRDLDVAELNEWLSGKEAADEFSGVVLVARNREILFHEAYGMASIRFGVKNRLDTRFNLGSLNKMFTAMAISKLMEEGKIDIDDTIGSFLNVFPDELANKVTIRHLLRMEAGWGDYWTNEDYLTSRSNMRLISDYMEFVENETLDFQPGTASQHCNTCYIVLGAIIEAVTGEDYFEYIRSTVYKPAGMTNSDSYDRDGPVKNLATGYTRYHPLASKDSKERWTNTYILSPRGSADGGGYSTAEDLLKFAKALRQYRLLSPVYTQFQLKQFTGSPEEVDLSAELTTGIRLAGGAPGVSTSLNLFLPGGYEIIVLSNYDVPVATQTAGEIMKRLGL